MAKAFITTVPFGTVSKKPIELLDEAGIEWQINPLGKKMTDDDFGDLIDDVDYVIAGLPNWTPDVLDKAKKLKLISRVGIGVDNIPFEECKKRGITVAYTPDAPTRAVGELVIGYIFDALRRYAFVDRKMREGEWNKHIGTQILGKTIGIIGTGRVGKLVIKFLQPFGVNIIANDIEEDHEFANKYNVKYSTKADIFRNADIISIHTSLNPTTEKFVDARYLSMMKPTAHIINTARGGVMNEDALYDALNNGSIGGATLDVYENEPYKGKLIQFDNVLLTAHIAAGTAESRLMMEQGAVEEVIRFHRGEPLLNPINHN